MGMSRWGRWAAVFLAGMVAGLVLAKGLPVERAIYEGKAPREAAKALLGLAESQAGKGTWELIGVGRVYYLSGDKTQGQAFFDRVLQNKPGKDDLDRIARVYAEAGDWDKAVPLFQSVLAKDPEDDSEQVFVGALYNLKGDRVKAEELFRAGFSRKADNVWKTLDAAGSYVGVHPN